MEDTMNSAELAGRRAQMDALDDQIISILLQRIELSSAILQSKAPGSAVDSAREQEILARYMAKLAGVSTPAKVKRLVSALVAASRLYPES